MDPTATDIPRPSLPMPTALLSLLMSPLSLPPRLTTSPPTDCPLVCTPVCPTPLDWPTPVWLPTPTALSSLLSLLMLLLPVPSTWLPTPRPKMNQEVCCCEDYLFLQIVVSFAVKHKLQ